MKIGSVVPSKCIMDNDLNCDEFNFEVPLANRQNSCIAMIDSR